MAAVQAKAAFEVELTVVDADGKPLDPPSDVLLDASLALQGGGVTLAGGDFHAGVGRATIGFEAGGASATLSARCGDASGSSAAFVVLPALPEKAKGSSPKVTNLNAIIDKSERARAVLLEAPANVGSEQLARLRAGRPVIGLNAASRNGPQAEKLGASRQGDGGTNCLCCTLGAITGKSTNDLVQTMMRTRLEPDVREAVAGDWKAELKRTSPHGDAEVEAAWIEYQRTNASAIAESVQRRLDQLVADYGTMQDEKIWWRLESLKNFLTDVGDKASGPSDDTLGDSQLRGTRDLLVAEARSRNQSGAAKYKVVQDGLADTDPMKGKTYDARNGELQRQMEKYPDGSQFQVFLYGPEMQHWLYAEKYNGKLVMEDYQKSKPKPASTISKAPATTATSYLLPELPHKPIDMEQADVFHQGYFLALCADGFDSSKAWAENPQWPQVSM